MVKRLTKQILKLEIPLKPDLAAVLIYRASCFQPYMPLDKSFR